jgi:precorrin-6Y C5,15-methyltransferase (decarboxylating)
MTAWLHIIGVGEMGLGELPASTRMILGYVETVLGPARFLAEIEPVMRMPGGGSIINPEFVTRRSLEAIARALSGDEDGDMRSSFSDGRTLIEWDGPLDRMLEQVLKLRDTPTAILSTGDPMWFGIGATLARHLSAGEYVVHTYPSAFQLAAARLHWPLQSVATISLHGRPVEVMHPHVLPGNRILALTTDRTTVDSVIELLINRGFGRSRLWVLENLGSAQEKITSGEAEGFETRAVEDFYVIAIDCISSVAAPLLPPIPGLPDEAFVNDGQITKREVRAATIARLAPFPGALLWDVGAGCGSISVEWMRAARDARAIAFEKHGDRAQLISINANALGVPGLQVEAGEAPTSLKDQPAPDAVFLGADVGNEELFDTCWQALRPGGRLVANAVTVESEGVLAAARARLGGELTRLSVARAAPVGGFTGWRPAMPVTIWSVAKP